MMPELVQLPLRTSDDRPLMHKFYRQQTDPTGIVMTFPGDHYGMDGPLLYYPVELLQVDGWDTLALGYGFKTAGKPFSLESIPDIFQECLTAVQVGLTQRDYKRIGLIGKSLGTGVVAHLCQIEPSLANARAVYLTPPIGSSLFRSAFAQTLQPAYIAIGTQDRFYDPEALDDLAASRSFQQCVIEGADHSMDVPGDLNASLKAVNRVVSEVVAFLKMD